jgi:uncharacterized FAD-dependent dehydrogenase
MSATRRLLFAVLRRHLTAVARPVVARRQISSVPLPPTIKMLREGVAAVGGKVVARGWVRQLRSQKSISFVELNDGSSLESLQVVCSPDLARSISLGSSVEIHGV